MSTASDLRDRLRFERKGLDARGRRTLDWDADGDHLEVQAGVTWLRRGEAVQQARLQGQSPVVIKVWASAASRGVDNSWRAIDLRSGRVINLTTPGEPTRDRLFLEFLGSADGSSGGV